MILRCADGADNQTVAAGLGVSSATVGKWRRRFVARGGRVVYGTDLGNQGPPPAVDTEELRLLVAAGLHPGQALAAATSTAAAHLGLAGTGRIAPGKRADLLLVDGDPLADLAALSRVRLVTRDGWVAANSGG